MILLLAFLFFAPFLYSQQSFPAKPGNYKHTLHFDQRERIYLLHLPSTYNKGIVYPLVIALHGGGGNGENIAAMSGLSVKADREGFIVVYPYGTGRFKERLLTWNAGNCCGYARENNIDDVGFIRSLINELERNYSIDPKRIFATGISNGGKMCYVLACALSEKIAAIAPVAGSMELPACSPKQPVSVVIFHGTKDQHILYSGGIPIKQVDRSPRVDSSVTFAVGYWVHHNQCSPTASMTQQGSIIKESYIQSTNGSAVILYTIKGGTHSWPGGKRGWILGEKPTEEISATELMWDFFSKHPKR
ncbi:MAG: PHB depolymerase family esterase [bacterium]